MATTLRKTLVLSFGFSSDEGAKATINITNPSDELTDEDIKTAMEAVVSNGVLGHKDLSGGADVVIEANYVNTETQELAL